MIKKILFQIFKILLFVKSKIIFCKDEQIIFLSGKKLKAEEFYKIIDLLNVIPVKQRRYFVVSFKEIDIRKYTKEQLKIIIDQID